MTTSPDFAEHRTDQTAWCPATARDREERGVGMKNCAPRHAAAARGAVQDASRAHLRLVEPPSAALSSDDHARGLPTQRINHDLDDDPPLTVLAW